MKHYLGTVRRSLFNVTASALVVDMADRRVGRDLREIRSVLLHNQNVGWNTRVEMISDPWSMLGFNRTKAAGREQMLSVLEKIEAACSAAYKSTRIDVQLLKDLGDTAGQLEFSFQDDAARNPLMVQLIVDTLYTQVEDLYDGAEQLARLK